MRGKPAYVKKEHIQDLLRQQWDIIERKRAEGRLDYEGYVKARAKLKKFTEIH